MFQMIDGDGGVPLRVADRGNPDGPVILFIHGMSQSELSFQKQYASHLAERFRLVSFDLRGHAGSAKPWDSSDYAGSRVWAADVAAVIEALDLDDVTLVGWSFGGYVAVSYLRHFGDERVRAVNLIGTAAGLVDIQAPSSQNPETIAESTKRRASLDLAESLAAIDEMPDMLTAKPMSPQDRALSYHTALMLPAYVLRAYADLPLDNKDMPSRLTIPFLLSIGTEDIGMDVPSAHRLDAALPHSSLSLYEGVGHFPSYEDPVRYNRELAEFVMAHAGAAKQ